MSRALMLTVALSVGCARPAPVCPSLAPRAKPAQAPAQDPLQLEYTPGAYADTPQLPARMSESPIRYFRAINRQFNDVVCASFPEADRNLPVVALHGDAHIEQYAVASDGRGLADFDGAALGPAIVDLMRFATSVYLIWPDRNEASHAVSALLEGYGQALANPALELTEPTAAARMRRSFAQTSEQWLTSVEALMQPLPPKEVGAYRAAFSKFARKTLRFRPDLTEGYFSIKRGGRFDAGIGSARQLKYLVRIEGPTAAVGDDLILEAKEASSDRLGSCMHSIGSGALRLVVGEARFGAGPQRLLGVGEFKGARFAVHAWRPHYSEITAGKIGSGVELAELARDVGAQFGRYHPALLAEPFASELRVELADFAEGLGPGLDARAAELAERVTRAWRAFRGQYPTLEGTSPKLTRGSPSSPRVSPRATD